MKPPTWLLAAGRDPEHYDSGWDDVFGRYVAATAARERLLVGR
jgi:hypothetical protein